MGRAVNQVWHIQRGALIWRHPVPGSVPGCVEFNASVPRRQKNEGVIALASCADKSGQRIEKYDQKVDGSFALRDTDSGTCVSVDDQSLRLRLAPCDAADRFENQS